MYLAYMDECGNTGTFADPAQPIHFLGCLVVEDINVRPLEDAVRAVAEKHFAEAAKHPRFEFHGVDLFAGKGFFKGASPDQRIAAAADLISAANEHSAGFGFTGVNKIKSYASDHPHRICFTLLAERLEHWLRDRDSIALLISDENHEVEQDIIKDIATFKATSTQWGYRRVPITRVIDSVHFVKSCNNPVIQLADVLTYLRQRDDQARDKHLDAFYALEVWTTGATWPEWLVSQQSRPEAATYKLMRSLKVPAFAGKIWPT